MILIDLMVLICVVIICIWNTKLHKRIDQMSVILTEFHKFLDQHPDIDRKWKLHLNRNGIHVERIVEEDTNSD